MPRESDVGDSAEMVSIDSWLRRLGDGYPEYKPKHEPPVYTQPNYTPPKKYVTRGRPRKNAPEKPTKPDQYKKHSRKAEDAQARIEQEFLDACVVEHPRSKNKWKAPHVQQCFDLTGKLIVGECAVCGITITEGVGSRLEHGVLCGRCTDNYEVGLGIMTRSRFPPDIGPNTPGDGRIIRKTISNKDLEVSWWPHRTNPRRLARGS